MLCLRLIFGLDSKEEDFNVIRFAYSKNATEVEEIP